MVPEDLNQPVAGLLILVDIIGFPVFSQVFAFFRLYIYSIATLWQFNFAIENGPCIDELHDQ